MTIAGVHEPLATAYPLIGCPMTVGMTGTVFRVAASRIGRMATADRGDNSTPSTIFPLAS
jgi:hypothetical protein